MSPPGRQHEPDDPRLKRLAVRRAVARGFDAFLLFLPASWPFLELLPESFGWAFALLASLVAEGACIWKFGATPGKLVMGLRVVTTSEPISFKTAVRRSMLVWVLGEAMGFWMVWNVSLAVAYRRYVDTRTTAWDEKCATDVVSLRRIEDGWLW